MSTCPNKRGWSDYSGDNLVVICHVNVVFLVFMCTWMHHTGEGKRLHAQPEQFLVVKKVCSFSISIPGKKGCHIGTIFNWCVPQAGSSGGPTIWPDMVWWPLI